MKTYPVSARIKSRIKRIMLHCSKSRNFGVFNINEDLLIAIRREKTNIDNLKRSK